MHCSGTLLFCLPSCADFDCFSWMSVIYWTLLWGSEWRWCCRGRKRSREHVSKPWEAYKIKTYNSKHHETVYQQWTGQVSQEWFCRSRVLWLGSWGKEKHKFAKKQETNMYFKVLKMRLLGWFNDPSLFQKHNFRYFNLILSQIQSY